MRLIIAEKAIAARRIAEILSKGKMKEIKHGSISLFDIGNNTIVFPLRGHILNVDYPEQYNDWRKINLHQLVDAPLQYKPAAHNIVKLLKHYAPKVTHITIATDYDTEGESIGREAIRIITEINPDVKVDRAKFSAITPEEVEHAFKHLVDFNQNLADAADTRREIDLIWGAVLTRFISLTSGRLGNQFLSVGRVQTPTLAMIVDRDKERKAFKPKTYWVLSAIFHKDIDFEATHKTDKFWEKPEQIYKKLKSAKYGIVTKITKREKKLKPPTPFNTTEFLRAASAIGITPSKAMDIAEQLYQSGLISYPRTDNTHYPPSIKIKSILKMFSEHKEFGDPAKKILSQKKIVPTKGKKKTTDHPPIHPVGLASRKSLDVHSWKIYELIVRRFFATLAPDCRLNTIRAEIDVEKEPFVANGQTIIDAGWKEFYPYSTVKESILPELSRGEEVLLKKLNLLEKQTKPKPLYTPASLIKEMEAKNLGTKSTRPEIIKKLISRHYIHGTKNYTPTDIAIAVINALEKHAPDITSPKMTAELEREMEQIENGKKKKEHVVKDSRKMLEKVLKELSNNYMGIGEELRTAAVDTSVVGKCKCGGDLRIITSKKTKKRFVGCTNYPKCNVSYPLPQRGKAIPTGKICEKCGTPIVKIILGKRSYEMCLDVNCETKKNWRKKKT
ncbi:MAG: DNA topoisomerase I [Candidatus Diapherotrites archaeon]|nr:DNA topoisomerase I [Candidatus Diapherotrites archaeon]